MTTFKLGDTVTGDPGSTEIETGQIIEADPGPDRYLVQWKSGLTTYKDASELRAGDGSDNGPASAGIDPSPQPDPDEDDD